MTTRVRTWSFSDCHVSRTAVMFLLRAAVASCWVRALIRCDASSATDRTPVERDTAVAMPVLDDLLQSPPMPKSGTPTLPPELDDWLAWNPKESPYCSSRAIALATSLIDRFWSVIPDSASFSDAVSVPVALVVRCQSTTATLVLSPGASARLCSSRPSVTPWADQLCSVVTIMPSAGRS
ncbi:hypothetical protein ACIQOW_08940 [Kitasatospora sp. NPDC091335]|uniref:hypothetical protein n=1 Tax=Kitasatospora sp. NPDC091335 TaxID=3364085 RepID=UPI00381F2A72